MRTIVRISLRAAVALALVLAIFDLRMPAQGLRPRVYVVDLSGSVLAHGRPESLTPRDAMRLVSWDVERSAPPDPSALILVGKREVIALPPTPRDSFRPPSPAVDPLGTDLDAALNAAVTLAGSGDIVLLTDGRACADGALSAAQSRGVPVHVMAIGPVQPVDVRIAGVDLPAAIPPGATYTVRISLASTAPAKGTLRVGPVARDFIFEGAAVQDIVIDGLTGSPLARIEIEDACPANNAALLQVLEREETPRTLILSPLPLPIPGDRAGDPSAYDVIVVHNASLSPAHMSRIADAVRAGAGLVLLGGPRAWALARWERTPLEEVSPLWAFPDERSAIVVLFDRSGSMKEPVPGMAVRRIDAAAGAVSEALSLVRDNDQLAAVPFSGDARALAPLGPGRDRGTLAASLHRLTPEGPTRLLPGFAEAFKLLDAATAPRRAIVLLTDGETEETDDALRQVAARLGDVSLTVIATGSAADAARLKLLGGAVLPVADWKALDRTLAEAFARSQELVAEPKEARGLPLPRRVNRTTAKPEAEVVATVDGAPLLAYGVAGRGRVAAGTFAYDSEWAGAMASWPGLADVVRRVAPSGRRAQVSASLDGDDLIVRATLPEGDLPDRLDATVNGTPLSLVRRGVRRFEGRMAVSAGTHLVRLDGQVVASAVHPCPAEFSGVGIDEAALDRIAAATGGRRLRFLQDVPPRRASEASRPLRPWLLVAAILLFLADVAVATFWR